MKPRALGGELVLGLVFAGAGLFWILSAAKMQLWDGFAPAAGFLPLVFGVLLLALAVAATLASAFTATDPAAEGMDSPAAAGFHRPTMVLLALATGVAGVEIVGFFVSMFLVMLFLFRVAERLPLIASFAASAGTALVLTLVFRVWLGVPLPVGPWGF